MISIVLTTYNRLDFLKKAIQSVKDQTFEDWELIVVDDCSTDGTQEYMQDIVNGRIQYKRLLENFGSDTRPKNIGTQLASYDYIMYLDDDVAYRPNALQTLWDNKKDNDVTYGDMWIVPQNEAGIAYDYDAQLLMIRNYIDSSSALVKKKAVYDVGGWDESLPKFVDWNLWVRMTKAGKKFERVQEFTFDYTIHEDTKSQRVKTETYTHPQLGTVFIPTFDTSGCYIDVGCLGMRQDNPTVAIFTIHYDRPEYSKETYNEMKKTAGYEFDWYCYNNGGTEEFGNAKWLGDGTNVGITKASNTLLDEIGDSYDIIIKIDNDVEFQTHGWLEDIVDMWKRNHMIYISPYVEGLYHNPGGAPRVGMGMIGDQYIEVTKHIGGIFAAISAEAYDDFRWEDKMLHGDQDVEASYNFRSKGYMPCYYPKHRICHRDGTLGQQDKLKDYFKKREDEKKTMA